MKVLACPLSNWGFCCGGMQYVNNKKQCGKEINYSIYNQTDKYQIDKQL